MSSRKRADGVHGGGLGRLPRTRRPVSTWPLPPTRVTLYPLDKCSKVPRQPLQVQPQAPGWSQLSVGAVVSPERAAGWPPAAIAQRTKKAPAVLLHHCESQWALLTLSSCSGNVWGLAEPPAFPRALGIFPPVHFALTVDLECNQVRMFQVPLLDSLPHDFL